MICLKGSPIVREAVRMKLNLAVIRHSSVMKEIYIPELSMCCKAVHNMYILLVSLCPFHKNCFYTCMHNCFIDTTEYSQLLAYN